MTPRRLLACAAILHVALAAALFAAGRARIAPALIDRDGIIAGVGPDSYLYQAAAIAPAEALRRGDVKGWARSQAPLHTRVIAIGFAALSPFAGYSTLAAEPYNLFCYLAVVALVLAIGREAGGARAGTIAAAIVAVWPTFLVHTLQLLKDPLFVAGALALVHIVLTWLTTAYDWRGAVRASAMLLVASGLVLLVRPQFVVFAVALVGVALALLAARQIVERRLMLPNASSAAVTFVVLAVTAWMLTGPTRPRDVLKQPSTDTGEPKAAAAEHVRTSIWRSPSRRGPWEAADRASLVLGSTRSRFAYTRGGGASIDETVIFLSARDVAAYLPRAAAIGLWTPFPGTWLTPGHSVGRSGRVLAGIETLTIYICEALAIAALLIPPRRIAASLLALLTAFGVTAEAMVVANLGALYRFRYTFWLLLIVLGAIGLVKLRSKAGAAAAVLLAALSASCAAPRPGPPADTLRVTNITGFPLRAVYLSPRGARTWQENILGRDPLADGRAVDVRFPPAAKPGEWDLRVDSTEGYRGEWTGLELGTVSTLTLRIGYGVLVADLEDER